MVFVKEQSQTINGTEYTYYYLYHSYRPGGSGTPTNFKVGKVGDDIDSIIDRLRSTASSEGIDLPQAEIKRFREKLREIDENSNSIEEKVELINEYNEQEKEDEEEDDYGEEEFDLEFKPEEDRDGFYSLQSSQDIQAGIEIKEDSGVKILSLYHLFIGEKHRDKGIGSRIIDNAEGLAEEKNVEAINVVIDGDEEVVDHIFKENRGYEEGIIENGSVEKRGTSWNLYHKKLDGFEEDKEEETGESEADSGGNEASDLNTDVPKWAVDFADEVVDTAEANFSQDDMLDYRRPVRVEVKSRDNSVSGLNKNASVNYDGRDVGAGIVKGKELESITVVERVEGFDRKRFEHIVAHESVHFVNGEHDIRFYEALMMVLDESFGGWKRYKDILILDMMANDVDPKILIDDEKVATKQEMERLNQLFVDQVALMNRELGMWGELTSKDGGVNLYGRMPVDGSFDYTMEFGRGRGKSKKTIVEANFGTGDVDVKSEKYWKYVVSAEYGDVKMRRLPENVFEAIDRLDESVAELKGGKTMKQKEEDRREKAIRNIPKWDFRQETDDRVFWFNEKYSVWAYYWKGGGNLVFDVERFGDTDQLSNQTPTPEAEVVYEDTDLETAVNYLRLNNDFILGEDLPGDAGEEDTGDKLESSLQGSWGIDESSESDGTYYYCIHKESDEEMLVIDQGRKIVGGDILAIMMRAQGKEFSRVVFSDDEDFVEYVSEVSGRWDENYEEILSSDGSSERVRNEILSVLSGEGGEMEIEMLYEEVDAGDGEIDDSLDALKREGLIYEPSRRRVSVV